MRLTRLSVLAAVIAGWGCGDNGGLRVTRLDAPSAGQSQSADPALGVSGTGNLTLSWIEGDGEVWALYTAGSTDGAGRWSSPIRVAGGSAAPGEVHPHGESSPRLVIGPGKHLALVWPNNIAVPERKWPAAMLRFSRSEDGGQHWSEPITLNDDTTAAPVSHQFHGATWVGDSGVAVAWLDERHVAAPIAGGTDGHAEHAAEPDATIYLARSADFGRTWGPNQIGWKAACPCCRITLARNPEGQAIAAWRQHFPGDVRDVVTAVLDPAPSSPERVHRDDWSYAGCPHTGPAMASGTDGVVHVVWYNGKPGAQGMYYARSLRQGGPATPVGLVTGSRVGPSHPAVAVLKDGGALAAYDLTAKGDRRIGVARLRPDGSVAGRVWLDDSDGGKYPQLAILGDTAAVVAWTASVGDGSRMRLVRLLLR